MVTMELGVRGSLVWGRMDAGVRLCSEGWEGSCDGADRSQKA